eukprot:11159972-Lingulodinium_polyedra.AAC.1
MLSDASAVVSAVAKGRSSRPGLGRVCRVIAAHLLATGSVLSLRWVPSEANPGNAPSREFAAAGYVGEAAGPPRRPGA